MIESNANRIAADGASLARQKYLAAFAGMLVLASAVYLLMIPWHSLDADHWFVPWLDHIIAYGPVSSLGHPMEINTDGANGSANYNPPYLYLLALGSYASPFLDSLTIIKLVSIGGAMMCAGCVFCLTRVFVSRQRAVLAAAGFLLLPTVALNSAAWGQTDTIYTGLMLLTIAAALNEAWIPMMLAFGAALAFKLPAAFIGPFVLYVVISRPVPLWAVFAVPAAYLASLFPAWLAGRPIQDLAAVYLDQAETYRWLSMNVPNPWSFIQHLHLIAYDQGVVIGLMAAAVAGLGIAALSLRWRLAGADLLLLAMASATIMPYLLPKMHDRYFFPADALTYVFAVVRPRRWSIVVAVAVELGSLGAYASLLFGFRVGTFLGALSITLALVVIGVQLLHALKRSDAALPMVRRVRDA